MESTETIAMENTETTSAVETPAAPARRRATTRTPRAKAAASETPEAAASDSESSPSSIPALDMLAPAPRATRTPRASAAAKKAAAAENAVSPEPNFMAPVSAPPPSPVSEAPAIRETSPAAPITIPETPVITAPVTIAPIPVPTLTPTLPPSLFGETCSPCLSVYLSRRARRQRRTRKS
jgi:hypothetical protein